MTFLNIKQSDIAIDDMLISETLRYASCNNNSDAAIFAKVKSIIHDLVRIMSPRAVFEVYPVEVTSSAIKFCDVVIPSTSLLRNLHGCTKIALLAATIGLPVDRYIHKCEAQSSGDALLAQASGAALIERVVDIANEAISQKAKDAAMTTRPRFSPGYGDVPLHVQRDFFRLLPCAKIGVSLMDTLIMSPEKSVTAFIGLLPTLN